jgi:hypothetical protein
VRGKLEQNHPYDFLKKKKNTQHVQQLMIKKKKNIGANYGFGYTFLFLAIYLLQMSPGAAIGKWAYWIMAYNVLLSIIIGFVVGYIARKMLKFAEQK